MVTNEHAGRLVKHPWETPGTTSRLLSVRLGASGKWWALVRECTPCEDGEFRRIDEFPADHVEVLP